MTRTLVRIIALTLLIGGVLLGWFVMSSENSYPFKLGLDLSGGTHLTYTADVSSLPQEERDEAMSALRRVIQHRVTSKNLAGVTGVLDSKVQTETVTLGHDKKQYRLIVELPGVTDTKKATDMIGKTPILEFKEQNPELSESEFQKALNSETKKVLQGATVSVGTGSTMSLSQAAEPATAASTPAPFVGTKLTGAYLKKARLDFSQGMAGGGGVSSGQPQVVLEFTNEGAQLFAEITERNVDNVVSIYLDGAPISTPVVRQQITGGEAVISGNFSVEEAKKLVRELNGGALPTPIELSSKQTIGGSLGDDATRAGVKAGVIGFIAVGIFLLLYYRIPGLIAVVALGIYAAIMLTLFKLIPVTLTAAGLAGFVISLGIAVDANILIFERIKEEIDRQSDLYEAIKTGFMRAWAPIRDANITSIIVSIVLFYTFGQTFIRGFAVTFGLGVLISMLTAITMTRFFLLALAPTINRGVKRWLFASGLKK